MVKLNESFTENLGRLTDKKAKAKLNRQGRTAVAYFGGSSGKDVRTGTSESDVMYGNAGDDVLNGGYGDDTLHGGSDEDQLIGGVGNDSLYGDSGHDRLFGGAGDDFMKGGTGSDMFTFAGFNYSGAVDTIDDFKVNEDGFDLRDGVMITGAVQESRDGTDPYMDVRVTLTSTNGSTQTVWLDDVVYGSNTVSALDAYFTSLGYSDFA